MQELITHYRPYLNGEKIQALFMFQMGTLWPSLDSVYRCCMQDERFEVCLALVEETAVETSHMEGAKKFLEEEKIKFCMYEDLHFDRYCPHIVFIQSPYDMISHTPDTLSLQFKRRGTRVIYVPYGIEIADTDTAIKDHFHSFVVENAWRIYTCCDGIKKEYIKYCHNRNAVRVCGTPKFDAICNKDKLPLRQDIVEQAQGRKIIVWKMHFPKKVKERGKICQVTPYITEYIEFAKKIGQYNDLFFVILVHPKMLKGVVASSDTQGDDSLMLQAQELLCILRNKENTYIDEDNDYRHSFYHADAIIMDRSALMIEAAMLEVPVLLMKNQDYSEPMTTPVENVVSSFWQGSCCKDMDEFIYDYKKGIDITIAKIRRAVEENFPFNDGKCGLRIVNDIADSLNEPQNNTLKVILYGIGEVCRYYMEKQHWNNDRRFEVLAVADSDKVKRDGDYYGIPIVSPQKLKELEFEAIVITTEPYYFEIKKSLIYEHYIDERKIWRIDEFVVALDDLTR